MNKKYELTDNIKVVDGHVLHQIKALRSFDGVRKGELGGWIESFLNLSHSGNAWVGENAEVYGNAEVWGNAWVYGNAQVFDYTQILGNAQVSDNAQVYGSAEVMDNAWVYDNAMVYGNAMVCGYAQVYKNAKVYGNSAIQSSINIRENDDIEDDSSYLVFNNNWSSRRQFVYVLSNQRWHVGCFDGTGEELIKKAYKDSELSGKMYEMYVHFAEQLVKSRQQG